MTRLKSMSFGRLSAAKNENLALAVSGVTGKIDLNQVHALSKITFSGSQGFYLHNAGQGTRFVDSQSHIISEKAAPQSDAPLIVELNGWKSEVQVFVED